jgi:hypothetical protein
VSFVAFVTFVWMTLARCGFTKIIDRIHHAPINAETDGLMSGCLSTAVE